MPLVNRTFDQLIDFTRTSAATFVNSSGNIASTPQSRNLLTFTQEFDNVAWTKNATTVTANSTAAPDGTMTADTLVASAGAAVHNCQQTAGGSGTQLAMSVYVKAGTNSFVQFWHGASVQMYANFNVSAGTVGTVGSSATASITSVGNGWYRCTMVFTPSASGTIRIALITSGTAAYNESWTAAGTETVFIWGAQLEAASSATDYTRNFGGLFPPRFDYDPVTRAPRGLLIEEQRTNLLTYSEDWTNAAWSKTNITVTAAATTSPDGTVDAQKLEATASAVTNNVSPSAAVAATSATFSVYVKQGTGATTANSFALRNVTTATTLILGTLNYSTGVFTYSVGSTGVTVTDAGNGWWRIVITATSGITSGNSLAGYVGFVGGSQTAGDHLFAWGAQLEAGAFATSYIPTVASQVTRSRDEASINAPNFASWYNSVEGTLLVEGSVLSTAGGGQCPTAGFDDGTASNRYIFFKGTGTAALTAYVNANATGNLMTLTANTPFKAALAFNSTGIAACANGGSVSTASGTTTGINRLSMGQNIGSISVLPGHVRSVRFYPVRLTNAQLQALTA